MVKKSLEDKKADGNPGHENLSDLELGEAPPLTVDDLPDDLGPAGRHLAEHLLLGGQAGRWVAKTDLGPFVRYCRLFELSERYRTEWELYVNKRVVVENSHGSLLIHPLLKAMQDASRVLTTLEKNLGFSPASRVSLGFRVEPGEGGGDSKGGDSASPIRGVIDGGLFG